MPASRLVKIPDELDFEQAAAAMLQGMTAHYLLHSSYKLQEGETALIHAAAGGVGLLLVQMAKKIGARVIAHRRHAGESATRARCRRGRMHRLHRSRL